MGRGDFSKGTFLSELSFMVKTYGVLMGGEEWTGE